MWSHEWEKDVVSAPLQKTVIKLLCEFTEQLDGTPLIQIASDQKVFICKSGEIFCLKKDFPTISW